LLRSRATLCFRGDRTGFEIDRLRMFRCRLHRLALCVVVAVCAVRLPAQSKVQREPQLDRQVIAQQNFGADAEWYLRSIPFLEIDDPEIQEIYYYRWKLYRSHIRQIGAQGTTVTEFLENVPWARQPYTDLNDSASFHLLEGRWLRDPAVVDSLIDHLYTGGGNDRHFSESIAAATEASTRVTGDPEPGLRHLDTMQHIFNLWDDHLDRARNLYWIEPLLDATEYTISSIDASGAGFTDTPSRDQNRNGFTGGFAYRPSINSYQYANALAIARFAALAGKADVAADYRRRAEAIRAAVLAQLWNPELGHFTDRYQRSTPFVKAGEFIRGRELVGYTPWMVELPPAMAGSANAAAWKHLLSPKQLGGPMGLRTVEPSYARYLTQYRYDQATGLRECQWNGPSWPFQTSQALTAIANVLDDYPATGMTSADYLRLLRQYTHQHYLSPGHPDVEEDYNPDTGGPIVGLPRSHHYNHSTYVDLVVSGLIGIRPRADEVLEVDPLVPVDGAAPIRYFALEQLRYHGHEIGIFYDVDGKRYQIGAGLSIFVDGRRAIGPGALVRTLVALPARLKGSSPVTIMPVDLAANPGFADGPVASASSTDSPYGITEGIDGRMWFFPENRNGWSPALGGGELNWYSVHFEQPRRVGAVELYFFSDGSEWMAPLRFHVQIRAKTGWIDVMNQHGNPEKPVGNGPNRLTFPAVSTQDMRVVFDGPAAPANFRLIELEAFGR
jgi:hypothetical protein